MTASQPRPTVARRQAFPAILFACLAASALVRAQERTTTSAVKTATAAPAVPAPKPIAEPDWLGEKAKLAELGKRFPNALALYNHLLKLAGGGTQHDRLSIPDWSGWYTLGDIPKNASVGSAGALENVDRPNSLMTDPDQRSSWPTAKLTPEYAAKLRERIRLTREEKIFYDPRMPKCLPPGYPRWIMEPWGREFIATPRQTWLMNELGNEVRRVYTDGRGHIPKDDGGMSYDGDTIGFWDADALVTHTEQLTDGLFQILQPDHTAEIESVEIWRKINDTDLVAYFWFYDPKVLEEPWFVRRIYRKDLNEDGFLRVKYYDCVGSSLNAVTEEPDAPAEFKN